MALQKKKSSTSKRKVLDLPSSATPSISSDSPARSNWQGKYKELLPEEDLITSTTKVPLGLVGDYESSSEEEEDSVDSKVKAFMKDVGKVAMDPVATTSKGVPVNGGSQYQVKGTTWMQCYDQNSGYPYYWNHATNEVSWQPPPEYVTALKIMQKQQAILTATAAMASKKPETPKVEEKPSKKYPWQTGSDSDDEKIELITSFGPKDNKEKTSKANAAPKKVKKLKTKKAVPVAGPQLPEDAPDVYETSSLMTPLVADVGPPGVEPPPQPSVADSSVSNGVSPQASEDEEGDVLTLLRQKAKQLREQKEPIVKSPPKEEANEFDADEILAEIEKEIPPDFVESLPPATEKPVASFALIANYGDDSETEEVAEPSVRKPLFPAAAASESIPAYKPLFPSAVSSETSNSGSPQPETLTVPSPTVSRSPSPHSMLELPDSTTALKAFQRKRRIEFTTAPARPESPKQEERECPAQYSMEAGEHRGFGFSQESTAPNKTSAISFVKSETVNFQPGTSATPTSSRPASPVPSQDLIDGASLLREKLAFLGEGREEVSAVQITAIQLETLVSAWQSGSLTPEYLCQWLGRRAVELLENEKSAAPPGWTCEWDREKKRYCYRSAKTGRKTWDYPEQEAADTQEQVPEVSIEEVEMEISDTPPRPSLSNEDPDPEPSREPTPPPPPVFERSSTPPPPPPPELRGNKASMPEVTSSSEDPPPLPLETYPPLPPDEPPPPGLEEMVVPPPPPPPVASVVTNSPAWLPPPPPPPDSSSQYLQPSSSFTLSRSSDIKTQPKRKRSLVSELDSFYSDLAMLDTTDSNSNEAENVRPPLPTSPAPKIPSPPASTTQEPPIKKKKKVKTGLTLKKKGVSSLVAKWQQVREDAKRNNSSDDEDDVSSTHRS